MLQTSQLVNQVNYDELRTVGGVVAATRNEIFEPCVFGIDESALSRASACVQAPYSFTAWSLNNGKRSPD